MRRVSFLTLFFVVGVVLTSSLSAQQAKPPELTVRATTDFLKLPDDVYFGEAVGVSLDSKGNIYVANRGKHPLMEFRPDGTFLRFIGEGLDVYEAPHSVFIDPQDAIWYVDAGTNLIIKMDQQTHLQMVLGKKPEAWTWETHVVEHGAPGPTFFYQPTGVAFAPDGSLFISDGYGNARILEYTAGGKRVKAWGSKGSGPGQFRIPHGIANDGKVLYVADRENARICQELLRRAITRRGVPDVLYTEYVPRNIFDVVCPAALCSWLSAAERSSRFDAGGSRH